MTDKQYTSDQVERLVNTGLMKMWYPVLPSWRVHSDPVGITRLSQKIVLWRDNKGAVHAIEDRCPHRGARLSLGWNLGDRLACWYHGIEMDGDGIVVNVPAMNNASMVGKQLRHPFFPERSVPVIADSYVERDFRILRFYRCTHGSGSRNRPGFSNLTRGAGLSYLQMWRKPQLLSPASTMLSTPA